MTKKKKMLKRVLSICLVVFISINSFAAIVADNDGSAFTTKAEFEAMKADFASQISNYQSSIEGKIDGAIASYLAGIRTTKTVIATNYFTNAKANNAKNLAFIRWKTPQAYKHVDDVRAGYSVVQSAGSGENRNNTTGNYYGYCQVANAGWGMGAYNECEYLGTSSYDSNGYYNAAKSNYTSAYYWVHFPFKGDDEKTNLSDFTLADVKRHRLYINLKANKDSYYSAARPETPAARFRGTITTDFTRLSQPGSFTHSSQGTNGTTTMTPICVQTHTWSDTSSSDTTNNAFLEYNIATNIPSSTFYAVEYEYRDYYNSNDSKRWTAGNTTLQIQRSSAAYGSNFQMAGSNVSFSRNGSAASNNGNGGNVYFNFKFNYQKKFALNWQRITNAYYNNLFGEPYYKYYGIPITDMTGTGKVTFTLKLTNSTADSFTYSIMDKRHINGAIQTTLKETYSGVSTERVLAKGTLSTKKTHVVNVAFDKKVIWDKTNGDYIYLKVEPSVAGQIVTADIPGSVFIEYKTY